MPLGEPVPGEGRRKTPARNDVLTDKQWEAIDSGKIGLSVSENGMCVARDCGAVRMDNTPRRAIEQLPGHP